KLKNPQIYSGNITLQPKSGYSEILSKLVVMREIKKTVTITFPEGTTLYEAANLLEKNGVCKADDFLFEFNKDQGYEFENLIDGNGNAFYAMEGYCFPDQYEFYQEDTGYNIAKIIKENFQKKFTDSMLNTMKKKNLTLNQLITLASIVQWESESVEQMPTVASVFLNRLNDPDTFPALQSDATSNYIKKVIEKAADTTAAAEHYTESYDTYNYKGLPAGPICNPGVEAINAVLNPNKTDYYYFCNNLKTKKTYYAKTLQEHEQNLVKAGLK
ncbi:MAG: endolytic transglycosylase MltG, partial [Oscillospiraceae bacterium]